MWKLIVGFIIFAALSLFVIMKGGNSLDMGGEKHGTETSESHAPAASAPVAAPAEAAASPASAPASK